MIKFILGLVLLTSQLFAAVPIGKTIEGTAFPGIAYERNLLKNGDFQFKKVTEGWTISNGTASAETSSYYFDQPQALKVAFTSINNTLFQQSSASNTFVMGYANIEASIWLVSDIAGVQVCSLRSGTELQCVDVIADSAWHKYTLNMPSTLIGDSYGIRVKTTSSISGNVYASKAYVGLARNIIGGAVPLTKWVTGSCTAGMSTNATTACSYFHQGNMLYVTQRINFTGGTNNANGLGLPTGFTIAGSTIITSATSGIFIAGSWYGDDASTQDYTGAIACYVGGTSCYMKNNGGTGVITNSSPWTMGSGDSISIYYAVPVVQSTPNLAIMPDNTNYGWRSYTPAISGFNGVSVSQCWEKREGEDNIVRCYWSATSGAGSEMRIPLNGYTSRSDLHTITYAGACATSNGANPDATTRVLVEPSKTYVVLSNSQTTQNQLTKPNGSDWWSGSVTHSCEFRVPIQGWAATQSAPLLVNSVVSDNPAATRLIWAVASSTCSSSPCTLARTSGPNVTSVTRTGTGAYTFNYTGFSVAPACWVMAANHTSQIQAYPSTTAFGFGIQNNISGTQTQADGGFMVFCMGAI